jgi:hypothetical protein
MGAGHTEKVRLGRLTVNKKQSDFMQQAFYDQTLILA